MQRRSRARQRGFTVTSELLTTLVVLGLVLLPLLVAAIGAGGGIARELDRTIVRNTQLSD